jgi:hypothetical protein
LKIISASNPQNYFSKRDRLCGEIYLEFTVQRFELVKQKGDSNLDPGHEEDHNEHAGHKAEEKTTTGKNFINKYLVIKNNLLSMKNVKTLKTNILYLVTVYFV